MRIGTRNWYKLVGAARFINFETANGPIPNAVWYTSAFICPRIVRDAFVTRENSSFANLSTVQDPDTFSRSLNEKARASQKREITAMFAASEQSRSPG